ncbi:MAG TPA: hypothetical protein VMV07_22690 [Streptosporangiaceae bacterium]|nr:hypothetical protein [Streptosporangiaceae bacterium]
MEQQEQLVATGGEDIRAYLAAQGMTEDDITKYLVQARGSGPAMASFTFGPDEAGIAPRYNLMFADEVYRLTVEHPA